MTKDGEPTDTRGEQESRRLELERTYIDGKMRRYGLLFAVNGGAFLILSTFAAEQSEPVAANEMETAIRRWIDFGPNPPFDPGFVALGALIFTLLMSLDLLFYGLGMRELEERWIKDEVMPACPTKFGQPRLFGLVGVLILMGLIALITTGWALTAQAFSAQQLLRKATWSLWAIWLIGLPATGFATKALKWPSRSRSGEIGG